MFLYTDRPKTSIYPSQFDAFQGKLRDGIKMCYECGDFKNREDRALAGRLDSCCHRESSAAIQDHSEVTTK